MRLYKHGRLNNYSRLAKIHILKSSSLINSKQIGILECCLPQISEHWPYRTPGTEEIKFTWFTRPGTASALTPREGIVQECKTSALVINTRTLLLIGATMRLSVSNWRNIPISRSDSGNIYESNEKPPPSDQKSVYSYSQYHWWPTALRVKFGDGESSIK
jgi:hypothetical protein